VLIKINTLVKININLRIKFRFESRFELIEALLRHNMYNRHSRIESIFLYCYRYTHIRRRFRFRAWQKVNQMINSSRSNHFKRGSFQEFAEASFKKPFFRAGHLVQRAGDIRVFLHENQYGTTVDFIAVVAVVILTYRAEHVSTPSFLSEGNWDRIGTSIVRTQFVKHCPDDAEWAGVSLV